MIKMKLCKLCDTEKPITEFYSDKSRKDGYEYRCKSCSTRLSVEWDLANKDKAKARKDRWLKKAIAQGTLIRERYDKAKTRKYKISTEKLEAMLIEQAGLCDCCGNQMRSINEPHIDHDHACCNMKGSCGKCIRGLLCARCNHMLGNVNDSVEVLQKAILYLGRYPKKVS
jgi:hypothetical protein